MAMRHHVVAPSRRPRSPVAVVVAASLILLIIFMSALAARTAGSTSPSVSSVVQDYEHNAPKSQDNQTTLRDKAAQPLSGLQQTSPLSPKLQPNVLSTFSSVPVPAIEPTTPEQSAFVQGYNQLKPTLSMASYIPFSDQATQGIILPAGKSLRLGSAYVTLQLLRNSLQCNLPVEIWHVAGEIDEHTKAVFETTFANVVCRDATRVPYPSHHKAANIQGYALKAFALYATSFTEVILLDADNLPVLDPSLLFTTPEYKLFGSMFCIWYAVLLADYDLDCNSLELCCRPDLFALPLSRVSGINAAAYNLLGWREPWANAAVGNGSFMFAESGQFLLDRRRHADVVEWAWFINSYGADGVYTQLMNGDKDSFLLAFVLANKTLEYYQVPEYVRLCLHNVAEGDKLEHVGILHHNTEGQVVFFHRTSGGKVNPLAAPGDVFSTDYTTVPLTAQAAWDIFDGAAETGNYRYPKDRIRTGMLSRCTLLQGNQLLYRPSCEAGLLQGDNALPVPALTNDDLQNTQLRAVYEYSNAQFQELQAMMQISDQQFLKQLAWYR